MSLSVCACTFDPGHRYDVALISVGYERRSSYLVRTGLTADHVAAFPFETLRDGSFDWNMEIVANSGAKIIDRPDGEFSGSALGFLRGTEADTKPHRRIAVDISSMSRRRLAQCVRVLHEYADGSELCVDFFYALAQHSSPPKSAPGTLSAEPVTPDFAGRLRRASLPVGAVFGLGYEPHRALGAFELLEPSRAWVFRPTGPDPTFEPEVVRANEQLLALVGDESVFSYDVTQGADVYYALESLVFAARDTFRLVVVPMGPKIFALASLLVALDEAPERPAVWRIGEIRSGDLTDVVEDGPIVGVRVEMGAS